MIRHLPFGFFLRDCDALSKFELFGDGLLCLSHAVREVQSTFAKTEHKVYSTRAQHTNNSEPSWLRKGLGRCPPVHSLSLPSFARCCGSFYCGSLGLLACTGYSQPVQQINSCLEGGIEGLTSLSGP